MDVNRKTAYLTLLTMEKNKAYSNLELNHQIQEEKPDSPAFCARAGLRRSEEQTLPGSSLVPVDSKRSERAEKRTLTLLRMGLYQIIYMESVPDYAAVNETVKLARRYLPGRDGFVNGVLRGYLRKKDQLLLPDRKKDPVAYFSVRYSYADWIVRLWLEQYGPEKNRRTPCSG